MKLKEILDPLFVLLEDAHAAEQYLQENDTQFARRAYIRSVFAYIEGTIWILKKACLNVKPISGKRRMSVTEYALLSEESYELKSNGESKIQTKYLRLPDNVKFIFKQVNKLFQADVELGVGKKEWENFQNALKIRHRITHLKDSQAFEINDKEIELCKEVCSWFNVLVLACFEAITQTSKKVTENA
jgi:hypothetical protein